MCVFCFLLLGFLREPWLLAMCPYGDLGLVIEESRSVDSVGGKGGVLESYRLWLQYCLCTDRLANAQLPVSVARFTILVDPKNLL